MMQWYVRRRVTTPTSLLLCGFYCGAIFGAHALPQVVDMFVLYPERVVQSGEIWRLVTYGIFPINFLSLVMLIIPTLWFGIYLEPALGPWRYLAIYLVPHAASGVMIVLMHSGILEGMPYAGSYMAASGAWAAFVAWAIAHFRSTNWRVRLLAIPVAYFLVAFAISPGFTIATHVVAWITGVILVYPALRKSQAASRRSST